MNTSDTKMAIMSTCSLFTHCLKSNFLKAALAIMKRISTKKILRFCMFTMRSMSVKLRALEVNALWIEAGDRTRNNAPTQNPANR